MRFEYSIQPEHLGEAFRWRAPGQRYKLGRGLFGWLLSAAPQETVADLMASLGKVQKCSICSA